MLSNMFGGKGQKNVKNSVKNRLVELQIDRKKHIFAYILRENGLVRLENCTKIIIIP